MSINFCWIYGDIGFPVKNGKITGFEICLDYKYNSIKNIYFTFSLDDIWISYKTFINR